jgi:predicted MFS family arabinose efflux permease
MPTAPQAPALHHERSVFDGWRSLVISLYMTLVGYGVLAGIPVISTAWATQLGFSDVQTGRVAGADLGGLALGAVLASLLVAQINRRLLVFLSALVAIAANALCMVLVDYEAVLWLRLLAGTGSGVYTAIAVANLGASSKPARAYNIMLFCFAFTQAGEMFALPRLSMDAIYGVFVAAYLFGLLFLRWVPPRPVEAGLDVEVELPDPELGSVVEHRHVPAVVPWLCLAAIAATYINIGAYWTYIELATARAALDKAWVSNVLVWVSFMSLLGCLVATVISNRFGLLRPLLVTLLAHATIVGMLAAGVTSVTFFISVYTFNFLWIFIDVYQMATVANVDHSGRFASLLPAAQGLGQIVGPNLAASTLALGFGYDAVFLFCAGASLVAFAIYAGLFLRLRRTLPALANAA